MFFISTTWELSVNKIDLITNTLAGPHQANQGSGPPSCTIPATDIRVILLKHLLMIQQFFKDHSKVGKLKLPTMHFY